MLRSLRNTVERNWGYVVSTVAAMLATAALTLMLTMSDIALAVSMLALSLAFLSFAIADRRSLNMDRTLRRLEPRIRKTQVSVRDLQRKNRALLQSARTSPDKIKTGIVQNSEQNANQLRKSVVTSAEQLTTALTDAEGRRRLDETLRESEHQQANEAALKTLNDMASRLDEAIDAIRRLEDRIVTMEDRPDDTTA